MNWARKIYPSITTGPKQSWQHKIWECNRLGVTEVAVFPTFLKLKERWKLYDALQKSKIKHIPHLHIRDDFQKWEIDFFIKITTLVILIFMSIRLMICINGPALLSIFILSITRTIL